MANSTFVFAYFQHNVIVVYQKAAPVEEHNVNVVHKVLKYVVWWKPEGAGCYRHSGTSRLSLSRDERWVPLTFWGSAVMDDPCTNFACCEGRGRQVKAHRVVQFSFPYSTGIVKCLFSKVPFSQQCKKYHEQVKNPSALSPTVSTQ